MQFVSKWMMDYIIICFWIVYFNIDMKLELVVKNLYIGSPYLYIYIYIYIYIYKHTHTYRLKSVPRITRIMSAVCYFV